LQSNARSAASSASRALRTSTKTFAHEVRDFQWNKGTTSTGTQLSNISYGGMIVGQ
jgi:phosphoribosyl-AMP cyclohydrolase